MYSPKCILLYFAVFCCMFMYPSRVMYRCVSKRPSNDTRKKRPIHAKRKTMYRSCTSVRRYTDRCIAGPIHDRYIGIFFMYRSFFACIWRWPLRYAPIHDSARIHAKYTAKYIKIHQNTFGGIHALDLGGIATMPEGETRGERENCKSERRWRSNSPGSTSRGV